MDKKELEKYKGKKILVGSPVYQEAEILNEFLKSLKELDNEEFVMGYCFIDDNSEEESKKLLKDFKENNDNVKILNMDTDVNKEYFCDDYTHRWDEDLVEKVTRFKNGIIKYFLETDYDYLFFIDSDIVLHPKSLKSLISRDKDILSNIFWTKWNPNAPELPQVWLKDAYTLYDANSVKPVSNGEANKQTKDFLNSLRKPGVYRVGGLGACTLIKRKPLEAGVNFTKMYNLSFWGEDRFFCIRAVAYGFELFVDTHYPAYHIYRKTDLEGVKTFKANSKNREYDILGYSIIDLVNEFLNEYYNYSYKEKITYNFMNLFVEEEGNRLKALRESEEEKIQKERITSKYKIEEWRIIFFENPNKVAVTFKLIIDGIKNEYTYTEGNNYVINLKNNDGIWEIEKIIKESPIIFSKKPFLRRVKDESKITLSMIVKNEEGRYLERVLEQNKKYIENAVIIDDGSTDRTKEIIKDILGDKNLTLIENKKSMFNNEVNLRKLQWIETLKTNPDWILSLDADEVFEDAFENQIIDLINSDPWCDAYSFRLYDFWDEENFREDKFWNAHKSYRTFLIRYQREFNYKWTENPLHCGRLPHNTSEFINKISNLRLKHYGWSRNEDRARKYLRYMEQDPNGEYGNMDQYKTILDKNPNLVRWYEKENN